MDANFDEKKAFDDLKNVLTYMYNFAGHYYAEMQKAQSACDEKDRKLADLQKQLADERVNADNRLTETINAKDEKISELENKISEQTENFESALKAQEDSFTAHLKKYGDYNMQLTQELQTLRADLEEKAGRLNKLAEKLKEDQDTLDLDKDNLRTEREKFNADKKAHETKLSNYASMEKQIENFDEERRKFKQDIQELQNKLDAKDGEWQGKLDKVIDEKNTLQIKVNSLKQELQGYTSAENSNETSAENRDENFSSNNNYDEHHHNGLIEMEK